MLCKQLVWTSKIKENHKLTESILGISKPPAYIFFLPLAIVEIYYQNQLNIIDYV